MRRELREEPMTPEARWGWKVTTTAVPAMSAKVNSARAMIFLIGFSCGSDCHRRRKA